MLVEGVAAHNFCDNDGVCTAEASTVRSKAHIGETATVCDIVASSRYAPSTKGQPTFFNLDKPYPNHIFTLLIWGESRAKFGAPETEYNGKLICTTGKIAEYRGVPEIVVDDPKQIKTGGAANQ